MPRSSSPSLRRIWLPWAATAATLCVLPAILHLYFATDIQRVAIAEKANLLGLAVEQLIGQRPLTWTFEVHRLEHVITLRGQLPEERISIKDEGGRTLVEVGAPVNWPCVAATHDLHDAGMVVGSLRVERGLMPLLPQLVATMVISIILGILVYVLAVRRPLREVARLTDRLSSERDSETARRIEAEEQLQRARRLEAISSMASGMAHFINNMLTPITMFADILRNKAVEGSRDREMLDRICESASRASALVASVLAFGRNSSQTLVPTRVDEMVAAVLELVRFRMPKGIILELRHDGPSGWVRVDAAQMGAAIHNLVNNALDALRENGGCVTVSLGCEMLTEESAQRLQLSAGRHAVIAIKDDGPGMTPEVASHAFEPFFTTKEIGKGTGLGLYTTYEIVRSQGGAVTLETEQGKGATFCIRLPQTPPP